MYLRSLILTDSDVFLTIGNDRGEEKFVLSPGRWKKLAAEYGVGEVDTDMSVAVSQKMYDAVCAAADATKAVRDGARVLAASPKSRRELIHKLCERGASRVSAEEAADLLIKRGYLDEEKQSLALARSLLRRNRYGKNRIRLYLTSHGYDSAAVHRALQQISPVEWREALMAILDGKYTPFPDTLAERQKAFAALARLGYSADEVNTVLRMRRY